MKTINGLQNFTDYFASFRDSYLIIGGTACYLLMEETGIEFRSTKDLDIILLFENTTKDFVKSFWTYIRKGKYKIWESKGEPRLFSCRDLATACTCGSCLAGSAFIVCNRLASRQECS